MRFCDRRATVFYTVPLPIDGSGDGCFKTEGTGYSSNLLINVWAINDYYLFFCFVICDTTLGYIRNDATNFLPFSILFPEYLKPAPGPTELSSSENIQKLPQVVFALPERGGLGLYP